MRVCFVLESNTDRRVLEGLASRCELTVLSRQLKLTEFPSDPARPFSVVVGPADRARYVPFVVRFLLSRCFDAVIAQGYFTAALGAGLAGRLRERPPTLLVCNPMERYYLARANGDWPDRPFRPAELRALRATAAAVARLAGRYAVLSEYLGEVVRGHGTRAPVSVIPVYGVDSRVFTPPRRPRSQLRAELRLPVGEPIVFLSARVAPEKDAGTLLAAVGRLQRRGRAPLLLACGWGHDRLRADAASLGLSDRLIARDSVAPGPDLARHYQACDLLVQASREEGLGFAPLEALA